MTDNEKATLCARIDELCAENERLRQELDGVPRCAACDAMLDCDECLRADALQKERKGLAYENAKLRELAHLVAEYVSEDQCEGCVTKRACNAGELDMCWIRKAILEKLRELGVDG